LKSDQPEAAILKEKRKGEKSETKKNSCVALKSDQPEGAIAAAPLCATFPGLTSGHGPPPQVGRNFAPRALIRHRLLRFWAAAGFFRCASRRI